MSYMVILVIGLFIGWLVAAMLELDEGVFANMALGAIGATIGSLVPRLFMGQHGSLVYMVWSVLGAFCLTGVARIITSPNKNSGL